MKESLSGLTQPLVVAKHARFVFLTFFILLLTGCRHPVFIHDVETEQKPWSHTNFFNNPDNFQFVIVSDRCGGHRPGVFPRAAQKLNLLRPEFVMSVGDLIEGYKTDKEAVIKERKEFDSFIKYFEMPFFYVPGNHDLSNKEMAKIWEDFFGRRYYYFIYKDVLFVCLDSQENIDENNNGKNLGAVQINWVKEVLQKYPYVRWTCFFMHQPLWVYEEPLIGADGKEYPPRITGFREIEKELAGRNYTVFAGHLHHYTKYIRNDKKYFILATTGAYSKLRGPFFGEFDHGVWVTMDEQGPVLANLMIDGIYDENVVTEKSAAFANSVQFVSDEEKSSDDKLIFRLPLKNQFHHSLEYNLTWNNAGRNWRISPDHAEGIIEPGKEEVIKFEAVPSAKESLLYPFCEARFHAGNEIDVIAKLEIERAIRRLKRPVSQALYIIEKPAINGNLDDPAWHNAQKIEDFQTMFGEKISAPTVAYTAYDETNLYVAVKCFEPNMAGIKAAVKKHNGPVWEDDSVEIFIDTNKDRKTYFQLIVNSIGTTYTNSSEIKPLLATGKDSESWMVEIAIPWKDLHSEAPEKSQIMGFLLVRTRTQKDEVQQYPALYGGNHQPDLFGDLRFE